ncbi:hypothetical protein GCM10010353_72160 [Streptomyces chryseus]|nr:hypothetical protein GCM10010353_72160 [Streptomyces chryseus]
MVRIVRATGGRCGAPCALCIVPRASGARASRKARCAPRIACIECAHHVAVRRPQAGANSYITYPLDFDLIGGRDRLWQGETLR